MAKKKKPTVGTALGKLPSLGKAAQPAPPAPFAGIPTPGPGAGLVGAGPAPQPFDPALEQQKQQAKWNVGLSDSEAGYQRGLTSYDTGYDASGARNFANPYSQAQLMEDEFRRSKMGTMNSYAAMGQYNSGARVRAEGRDDRLYAQSSDALQRGAAQTYHGLGAQQLQTYGQNSVGVSAEAMAALRRAIYGS
jgi:hypothetical protein